jgi:DNA-binding transcriptional MerR regulator
MLRIGDFGRIARVSVQTLRHYDDLGLLKPVEVDAFTGYRYYAFDQLPRLHRILALKDLGLSLEEIAELMALWDADECRPVATRLRDLVDDKIRATRARIVELEAFTVDLARFRANLAPDDAVGACGPDCACQGGAAATPSRPATLSLSATRGRS